MNLRLALPIVFAFAFPNLIMPVQAQVVPGTGQEIVEVFDNFEDPNWNYTLNLPKSSSNIDKVERHPSGFSNNRTFLESLYRGTPDFVHRIETPPGGIPGSTGSLAMQTLNSGIPGQLSHTFQQDDLIAGVQQKLGYMMPVSWTPSYVCRVYVPPFDKWERRHGSHFGYRADCTTTIDKPTSMGRFFKNFGKHKVQEQYWPGFFIQLNLKQMTGQPEDFATILIRSDTSGHDVPGPKITHAGWWTLGMSFTPDGKVHYYAHEGVGNLTAKDHLYSNFPYGYKCEQTSTYFFNIVNQDDGKSWSTRWIVDDPKVYVASGTYRPSVPQPMAQKPTPATVQAAPAAPVAAVQPQSVKQLPSVPPAVVAAPPAPKTPAVPVLAPVATKSAPMPKPAVAVQKPTIDLSKLPQLATKPVEIQAKEPKVEAPTEVPQPLPVPIPETKSDSTKPIPAPVVEESPDAVTPASESDFDAPPAPSPAVELPSEVPTPPAEVPPPVAETPPQPLPPVPAMPE